MTDLPQLLRALCRALIITTSFICLNAYGCNGATGTGFCIDNGMGGTGYRGVVIPDKDKEAIKAEQERQEKARREKAKREQAAKNQALKNTQRNNGIIKARKAINADHNRKKNALQIECRRKSNNLRSQFQKRMLDYDVALRQRLNSLPVAMDAKQRLQAEGRLKSNTVQQKRTLMSDNKRRQLIITRECADRTRLLDKQYKLRIADFERTLKKR